MVWLAIASALVVGFFAGAAVQLWTHGTYRQGLEEMDKLLSQWGWSEGTVKVRQLLSNRRR